MKPTTAENTSTVATRTVVVQAGTYGEHRFSAVRCTEPGETSRSVEVNDRYLEVTMQPGAILEIDAEVDRFSNTPSYTEPWS